MALPGRRRICGPSFLLDSLRPDANGPGLLGPALLGKSHAHCRTRLSRRCAAAFHWGHSHAGGSRAGSGNGQRVQVLLLYFIVPGKGVASFLDLR